MMDWVDSTIAGKKILNEYIGKQTTAHRSLGGSLEHG